MEKKEKVGALGMRGAGEVLNFAQEANLGESLDCSASTIYLSVQ